MDLLSELGGMIDSVFDAFEGPTALPEARGCRVRKHPRPCGYVIVSSQAPKAVLPRGKVFQSPAELGKALRAAARYLLEKDPSNFSAQGRALGGRRYYSTDVRRISDGFERRIYVNRHDTGRAEWFQ